MYVVVHESYSLEFPIKNHKTIPKRFEELASFIENYLNLMFSGKFFTLNLNHFFNKGFHGLFFKSSTCIVHTRCGEKI